MKETKRMAKSHVIPRAFFNHDGKTDKFLISNTAYKIRRPIGSYDPNILCQDCEAQFSDIDSQAADILLKRFETNLIPFGDQRDEEAYQFDGRHWQAIKRFLIYTLWRASVSILPEFSRVSLGPYEDIIKNTLMYNKEIKVHEFCFLATRIQKPSAYFLPMKRNRQNYNGQRYYMLSLGNFIFDIKVGGQPPIGIHRIVAEHPHIVFIKQARNEGKIREAMIDTLKKHEAKFGKLPKL
jgi:hypothetical protein